jgi:hypothetical protein
VKALKNLGYVLVLLVLGLALVGLYLPGTAAVERRLTIAATPDVLFPLLDSPPAFTRWSPLATPGTTVRYAFDGPANGVGAGLSWEGGTFPLNAGSYTITAVEDLRRIELRVHLPLLGKTHSRIDVRPVGGTGATEVDWSFHDDVGFNLPRRLLWLLADLTLGPRLERGLDNLRDLAERR